MSSNVRQSMRSRVASMAGDRPTWLLVVIGHGAVLGIALGLTSLQGALTKPGSSGDETDPRAEDIAWLDADLTLPPPPPEPVAEVTPPPPPPVIEAKLEPAPPPTPAPMPEPAPLVMEPPKVDFAPPAPEPPPVEVKPPAEPPLRAELVNKPTPLELPTPPVVPKPAPKAELVAKAKSTPAPGPIPAAPKPGELSLPQLQVYQQQIHDKFSRQWLRPYHLAYAGKEFVATVRFRVRRDGTISNVTLAAPSGNKEMDKSVMQAAKRVTQLAPIPADARSKYYDIAVQFALTPVKK